MSVLKCENCGAALSISSDAKTLKCGYCGAESEIGLYKNIESPDEWQVEEPAIVNNGEIDPRIVYGALLILAAIIGVTFAFFRYVKT